MYDCLHTHIWLVNILPVSGAEVLLLLYTKPLVLTEAVLGQAYFVDTARHSH